MFSASYQLFCVIVRVVQHVLWVCQPPITIAKCKRIGFMISWPKLHMSPFFAGHVTVRFARAWCVFISRDRVYGDCLCLLLYYEDGMMGLWLCFIPGCFEHPILALAFLVPVPSFSFKGVGICHAIGENKPKTTVCATRLCMTVETSWRDPGESDCSSWAMGSACAATKAKQCNLRIQKKRQQLPYVWGWWGWFRSRSCMVSLVMCMHIMYVYIYIYVCTIIIQLYIYIFIHTYCKYRYGCIQSYPCCLTWLHLHPACFVFRALHEPAPFLEKCSLFHGEIPMFPWVFRTIFPAEKPLADGGMPPWLRSTLL